MELSTRNTADIYAGDSGLRPLPRVHLPEGTTIQPRPFYKMPVIPDVSSGGLISGNTRSPLQGVVWQVSAIFVQTTSSTGKQGTLLTVNVMYMWLYIDLINEPYILCRRLKDSEGRELPIWERTWKLKVDKLDDDHREGMTLDTPMLWLYVDLCVMSLEVVSSALSRTKRPPNDWPSFTTPNIVCFSCRFYKVF